MYSILMRVMRWLTFVASGAMLFQVGGCTTGLEVAQTGLLAAIAGMVFFLSRNV